MDTRTTEQRRYIMQSVKTKHTGPELAVRAMVRALGVPYRLHPKTLSGRPDIAVPTLRKAIFVHGCFWHGHNCRYGRLPKSNIRYWRDKIRRNKLRDSTNRKTLKNQGWETLVVWQCHLKDEVKLLLRLNAFLKH